MAVEPKNGYDPLPSQLVCSQASDNLNATKVLFEISEYVKRTTSVYIIAKINYFDIS